MKATTTLGLLLAGSLATCYYFYSELKKLSAVEVLECCDERGYVEPREITDDQARTFQRAYKETLVDPDSITGGIITKAAFDSLLCADKCNAISYSLGIDVTGKVGPGGNGVFIVISGVNASIDESTGAISKIEPLGLPKYIAQHWCPPTCAPHE